MHFFPITPRVGSRARTRSSEGICSAGAELCIATTCSDFVSSGATRVAAVTGASALALLGLATRFGEASVLVSGVWMLRFREPPNMCMLLDGWLLVLKRDEPELECELAEPTPFKMSPCTESLSSVGIGGGSAFRSDVSSERWVIALSAKAFALVWVSAAERVLVGSAC